MVAIICRNQDQRSSIRILEIWKSGWRRNVLVVDISKNLVRNGEVLPNLLSLYNTKQQPKKQNTEDRSERHDAIMFETAVPLRDESE